MNESPKTLHTANAHGPVFFGDVTYPPGGALGPRTQGDFQLVIMHRGELELELDGRPIHVPAGCAILLYPGHREDFVFAREDQTRHSWCSITPEALPAPWSESLGRGSVPVPFGPRLSALLEIALAMPPSTQADHGVALGLALALCGEAARLARRQQLVPEAPHGDAAVAKARAFIQRELAQPLDLAQISRAAGVSRQHLLKLFRERGLPTPTEYLYARRLETAAHLLSHTGLSIAEISEQTGFTNPYHFSRKFSQTHGLSPRAWRQALWKPNQAKSSLAERGG